MKEMLADSKLIARCGLYCGACKKFLNEKCPGCEKNEKASWCEIRKCCADRNYNNCSECSDYDDVMKCKKFNNFISKFFALVFHSDRKASIQYIKEHGAQRYATFMVENKQMVFRR